MSPKKFPDICDNCGKEHNASCLQCEYVTALDDVKTDESVFSSPDFFQAKMRSEKWEAEDYITRMQLIRTLSNTIKDEISAAENRIQDNVTNHFDTTLEKLFAKKVSNNSSLIGNILFVIFLIAVGYWLGCIFR